MKILYAIQGNGNGHVSRAKELIPALRNRANVDVLISGSQYSVDLPFNVNYTFRGIDLFYTRNGKVNYWKTLVKNKLFRVLREIVQCQVKSYDLVINDFEPISAWASYIRGVRCVSLSHQAALSYQKVPKPDAKSRLGSFILANYAPSSRKFGFHFKSYEKEIFTPVIRKEIRQQKIQEKNFYTVYLPSYSEKEIIKVLSKLDAVKFKVFSATCKKAYQRKNVFVKPIKTGTFERSLASGKGVICGAGFETPAEALFLKKKLLVIPIRGQLEQLYNAESLKQMGVTVLSKLSEKKVSKIQRWISTGESLEINYPDKTQDIVDKILTNHIITTQLANQIIENS
ncbi:glycosyl transferase [Flavobacteriaceae bacterium F08102]|nr:glycosyl transferase [Flavobacteriaceae bacterium F08102]